MRLLVGGVIVGTLSGCGLILGLSDPQLASVASDAGPPPDAAARFRIIVEISGDGSGHVRSSPEGIDCPGQCSGDFNEGSRVVLQGYADGGSSFTGWVKPCTGIDACAIDVSADTVVEGAFHDNSGGHNFVFVTSETYPVTQFSPLSAADALCNASAAAAGMPGTYVAWLSSTNIDARDRLSGARGWVRADGLPFADTVTDIGNGVILDPVALTAAGRAIDAYVATGTDPSGAVGPHTCDDWTNQSGLVTIGTTSATAKSWTQYGAPDYGDDCSVARSIYCFGTSHNAPLAPARATGRLAFVVVGVGSGGGVAGADAQCQHAAMLAGKTGTFKALIATSSMAAADRFDASGSPWVRADGVLVAASGGNPFEDGFVTPVNVTADGLYIQDAYVMTGAPAATLRGSKTTTCNDWMATAATSNLIAGDLTVVRDSFGNADTLLPCDGASYGLYCFQQ